MCLRCLGTKHDWTDGTKKRWSRLFVYAVVFLFLPRSLNILFRNLYFMNLILMTKSTLSTQFVQVHGNNHWRISQVRLKKLNYRTLVLVRDWSEIIIRQLHIAGIKFHVIRWMAHAWTPVQSTPPNAPKFPFVTSCSCCWKDSMRILKSCAIWALSVACNKSEVIYSMITRLMNADEPWSDAISRFKMWPLKRDELQILGVQGQLQKRMECS
jgi:hypothetical protein